MEWDLGFAGLALLAAMSVGAGVVTQLLGGRGMTRWLGPVAGAVYFVTGLVVSEVWFGWATEEDLQPNIDGLSFDEVLLIGLLPVAALVVAARMAARRGARGRHERSSHRPVPH